MNTTHSEALRNHIDSFCGEEPDQFFKESSVGINVAKFNDVPDQGLTTFISIGFSSHLLMQDSGKNIRQELLITVDNMHSDLPIEEIIFSVSKLMLNSHKAVMHGQVIGPRGFLFPEEKKIHLTSLLCSYPAFFPEDFSFFENENVTVFVELIPTLTSEAKLVNKEGWSKFFDKIDEGEIDILNYYRQ